MSRFNYLLFGGLCLMIGLQLVLGQVGFPEGVDQDKAKANLNGRTPIYIPSRCKAHELLYPGDQKDDWVCDCAPAALYYPESDGCFPAFRQGPCPPNQILVLGNNNIIPECIPNACQVDGQIQIQKVCYELGKPGPCPSSHLNYVLGVDPKTMHIDCVIPFVSLASRFGMETPSPYDLSKAEICARGSKRAIQGTCPNRK
ncbi:uncharacterized protein LOC133336723 [Musca vetustissima]|uniref:uncharacterized protein LOC133336723 n=1 Tax=Musca vetustissima TaxID=27455 RepID=UPI002AB61FF8|nr:uncharacterized protein LOC133336723 [Musca vetustissima]